MNKETFIETLCDIYKKERNTIVKRKHGKSSEITFGQLSGLIFTENTTTSICEVLSTSPKTLRKAMTEAYPDITAGNKGTVWRVELLSKLGYRRCTICKTDKSIEEFYNSINSREGKSWHCKECAKDLNKLQRELRPEIIIASNRKRKAITKGAFTEEANLSLIKLIYKNCPEGYHVDHIIPIAKGGKHHETNLCYLPAKLNMEKHTKLPEEVPEIMSYAIYPNLEELQ